MSSIVVGFIGVGEAGAAFAGGLREAGATVYGYDARADTTIVRDRAQRSGVVLLDGLSELADRCPVLINLTSATVAVPVARSIAPSLRPDHRYADLNSASPAVKQEAATIVEATGAAFTDGAVMAAVPPRRHRVPILLSGGGAQAFLDVLAPFGVEMEVLGDRPGQSSAVKMLRSLLVKGLEALLLECAVGAAHYGVTHRVLDSMNGTLPTENWNELARYLMSRTLPHATRRAEELRQVAATLTAADVDPMVATAGASRLQWLADLDLPHPPGDLSTDDYDAVLERLTEARK